MSENFVVQACEHGKMYPLCLECFNAVKAENSELKVSLQKAQEENECLKILRDEQFVALRIYREALEKIEKVSQFTVPVPGPTVTSEHYEAAWLECVYIAKSALETSLEGKGE